MLRCVVPVTLGAAPALHVVTNRISPYIDSLSSSKVVAMDIVMLTDQIYLHATPAAQEATQPIDASLTQPFMFLTHIWCCQHSEAEPLRSRLRVMLQFATDSH